MGPSFATLHLLAIMHVMSSSLGPESPDPPVVQSSDDQDKPATTNTPVVAMHRGWTGVSDPMPRSVIDMGGQEVLDWHQRQAHSRALRAWANDPRGHAWVPGSTCSVQVSGDSPDLFMRDLVVITIRVPAFLLDAALDPLDWDEGDVLIKVDDNRQEPGGELL